MRKTDSIVWLFGVIFVPFWDKVLFQFWSGLFWQNIKLK